MRKATLVALVAALVALTTATARAGTTFTVTNDHDSGPGSLRQAILDANASPGKDKIAFDLPGPASIFPNTELPAVTDPIDIDGTTDPGYNGTPFVLLFGTGNTLAPPLAYGLDIQAGKSEVSGLAIGGFETGIVLEGAPGDTVTASVIGANLGGTSAVPNGTGISITNSNDEIGGTRKGDGNVISGNAGYGNSGVTGYGVWIKGDPASGSGSPTGNAIQGNLIGTNGSGTAALPNGIAGVEVVGATNTVVGGSLLLGAGNVISGNELMGVESNFSSGGVISSNLIGTSADGQNAIPNTDGIAIVGGENNLVGLSTGPNFIRGGGNVISGNVQGVLVAQGATSPTVDTTIAGNVIGLAGDAKTPLGNQYAGVWLDWVTGTTVGTPRDPNTIADNGGGGVVVNGDGAYGDTISANSIFGNGLLGIDLNDDLVTLNDPGDSDTGPNGLQNFPVITSVTHQGGQLVIGGTLNSRPFGTYRLEFFANPTCDPSGYGQGQTYLGAKTIVADPFGNVTFSAKFPLKPSAPTPIVTATATDGSGNTSEFSACSSGG
ncbi:MAG TPA: hypothetical protein VHS03_09605 [Gaiellaceae bacterium]|jgi:hypothetical protein|nr:hypothetical protein [Gaiellaceae bacterium]